MVDSSAPSNIILRKGLEELENLRGRLADQPYSILLRLKLAEAYRSLGYPDLAAGDAYKALLLVDEVLEEGEYHEQALDAANSDATFMKIDGSEADLCSELSRFNLTVPAVHAQVQDQDDDSEAIAYAKSVWSAIAYYILVGSLVDCGCLRSAFQFNTRALKGFPNEVLFQDYQAALRVKLRAYFDAQGENLEGVDISEYPDKGLVRRELYPWNEFEPDRYSPETIQLLNDNMSRIAPKLEVRVVKLPLLSHRTEDSSGLSQPHDTVDYVQQLGVFAKEDIPPGEVILNEKSLLTGIARLHESYCDACSKPLSEDEIDDSRSCEDCAEVYFCSEECQELSQEFYHPAICGVNTEQKVPASEAADSLYTLLLVRALALAEVQDLHPLKLKEVRYIWGDYHGVKLDLELKLDSKKRENPLGPFGSVPQTLPFSFNGNILTPLNILEKMDVNIFERSHRYDTWVFNTLYAKFRGTASAQQALDGRPEIGAVHPEWCLANHSCDPNVAWEWKGSMKFWTREKLIDWKGRDPSVQPGIRKGQEVLSHYCDVRLPVQERREWAVGALGGRCMCPRCVWEEAHG